MMQTTYKKTNVSEQNHCRRKSTQTTFPSKPKEPIGNNVLGKAPFVPTAVGATTRPWLTRADHGNHRKPLVSALTAPSEHRPGRAQGSPTSGKLRFPGNSDKALVKTTFRACVHLPRLLKLHNKAPDNRDALRRKACDFHSSHSW